MSSITKRTGSLVAGAMLASLAFGQSQPTEKEIATVVNSNIMEEFNYNPLSSAQRLLNYNGYKLMDIVGDTCQLRMRTTPELLPEDLRSGCITNVSIKALHYGRITLAAVDPMPLSELVDELDKDKLFTFSAIYNDMYGRLRWMVDEPVDRGKKRVWIKRESGKERIEAEKERREAAILTAWETQIYRAEQKKMKKFVRK